MKRRSSSRGLGGGRPVTVTLISPYFEPEHAGSAPYVTQVARHLALNYKVTVLTGVPHYPEWRIAPGYDRWRSVETVGQLEVRRLRHFVPRKQTALTRGLYEASFAGRVLLESMKLRSDVVISFTPPVLSTAAAVVVTLGRRTALGVVVHDLAGLGARESGIRGGARVARLVAWIEGTSLSRAQGIVVLHRQFVPLVSRLAGVGQQRVRVIRNWSKRQQPSGDREANRAAMGWSPHECVVVHSGNMGMKQGLENIVLAARIADERRADVRFVLMGDGSQRSSLEALARGVERLTMLPPSEEGTFVNMLDAADILVVNEKPGVSEMSVPSKLTAYFRAGRPVVLASSPDSPAAAEVFDAAAGPRVPSGEPHALLDAILRLHARPDEAARAGAAAQAFAAREFDAASALERYTAWVEDLVRGVRRRSD